MFSAQYNKNSFIYENAVNIMILLLAFAAIEFITIKLPGRFGRSYISLTQYRWLEYLFLSACSLCAVYFRGDGNVFIYFQF